MEFLVDVVEEGRGLSVERLLTSDSRGVASGRSCYRIANIIVLSAGRSCDNIKHCILYKTC